MPKNSVRIDDRAWNKLITRLRKETQRDLEIGVFSTAGNYPNGKPVAEVAIIHEFGAPGANIPERSFVRSTIRNERREITKRLIDISARLIEKRPPPGQLFSGLGSFIATKIKQRILIGTPISPGLTPSTIRKKGHARPLVDTERLANSIRWRVVKD